MENRKILSIKKDSSKRTLIIVGSVFLVFFILIILASYGSKNKKITKKETTTTNKNENHSTGGLSAKLEEKYKTLIDAYTYQYQAEDFLHSNGFKQVSSNYETAPDGSKQLMQTFTKAEDSYTVSVTLQPSYSMKTYYRTVEAIP